MYDTLILNYNQWLMQRPLNIINIHITLFYYIDLVIIIGKR